jgi:DNA-directed RNA polymerase specialized sigma subunit
MRMMIKYFLEDRLGTQKDVAELLGITQGYVSQLISEGQRESP